ncbi:MAG: DNA polymerase III subunit alpha, partial [Ignavibacteria bacterium]|nr:DNA polymerase III subunit alpha [Ignavibacteria bacterium]
ITNVDPLKYNLLFERFLNPDRISMPDIDIDFADDKRYKVIEYVKEKYGANAVAQIITFSKLSSRAVLTDVARVLSIPLNTVKEITSKIPVILGKVMPIVDAIELPDLKWLKETKDEKLQELIEYSKMLENRNRAVSTHAAGVVIAPGEITDFVPVAPPAKSDKDSNDVVTQYSMAELESAGLVKMDFLGLKTLSVIENTLNMIKENYGKDIDIDKIDFDDPDTYNLISEGHTLAVFQFESDGMQDYLRKLKPQNLEELTAMNALYRPGPMENIPEFIDRKFGRKPIEYLHPYMEESLKNTYGIIVYQEQVMQLVQKIAGFSLGQADILRRAMGKKKKSEMDKMKPLFIEGAKNNGINEKLAQEIFDLIEKFANYGFNKSHSLAYSYLAFQTAWLKTHYPAEFLAANMTNEINNQDKIVELIDETKKFNIKVLPPDINQSSTNFIARENVIYFGLAAIKNVGIPAVDNIVQARKDGDFTSFFDFVRRVDTSLINRRTIEALICAGAFDKLHPNCRASLFESIDIALDYAKAYQNYKAEATDSLFGGQSDTEPKMPKLSNVEEWEQSKKLEKEKEYLNFYISGHPLQDYEIILKSVNSFNFSSVDNPQIGDYLRVMGLVSEIRTRFDKNKNTVGFITLEDFSSKLRVIFWSDAYSQYQNVIEKDKPLVVVGNSSFSGEFIEIVADQAYSIEEFFQKYVEGFKIWIDVDNITEKKIEEMADKLEKSDKETKIQFFIKNAESKKNYIAFNQYFSVSTKNIDLLCEIFGEENIRLLISNVEKPTKKNGNRWSKN